MAATRNQIVLRALAAAVRANVPTLLWGAPGIAKTASVTAHAEAWGYHVETVIGSVREASDFMGLPMEVDGEVVYSTLAWARRLADASTGLLFLDELTTAAPSVQRVMLRVLQERFVGDFRLPDSVAIVAAANPPDVAVDGWDLAAPVANRLFHLDWHLDLDGWLAGVLTDFADFEAPGMDSLCGPGTDLDAARVRGAVTSFLRSRPDLVSNVPSDPAAAGKGWPSPRSWSNAMSILAHVDRDDEETALVVLTGCVGEGAANEFAAWMLANDLFDPDEVLRDPSIVAWSEDRPDRLFALVGSIGALARVRGDKRTWERAAKVMVACAKGGKPDVAVPTTRHLLNHRPEGCSPSAAMREAFAPMFTQMDRWAA